MQSIKIKPNDPHAGIVDTQAVQFEKDGWSDLPHFEPNLSMHINASTKMKQQEQQQQQQQQLLK